MNIRLTRPALLLGVLAAACASTPTTDEVEVSIRVAGFVKAEGITWLGWPNRVEEALEGLPGVEHVSVDLADDRFDVRFDPDFVTTADLFERIVSLGYEPRVVDSEPGQVVEPRDRVVLGQLAPSVRAPLEGAARRGQLALVDFTAPGWVTCAQMDAVTYPHPSVIRELEPWTVVVVDVSRTPDVAAAFGVPAVPVAVAVGPGGAILGRIRGFVEPDDFVAWLRSMDSPPASGE